MTETPVPPSQDEPLTGPSQPSDEMTTPASVPEPAPAEPTATPAGMPAAVPAGMPNVGKVRETGTCFLLMIVTLGIYGFVWYFKTHEEMKRHTGTGLGGGIALLLAIFVGIVMPFLNSNEVGQLYSRRGQKPPVTAVTGLWVLLLGWFFFVGLIVWFVKTNGALNAYWRSLGAQ
jgi:hypothetical protein